jgi:hypothetical protein
VGDSHARGMAAKLHQNLGDEYSVQGQVKPGANLAAILASCVSDIKDFSKKDVLIVWGGSRDVSRNESVKGLIQINNFIKKNSHTNILVMTLPNRLDLVVTSCVNQETMVFNRKLCKLVKAYNHAIAIVNNFQSGHHTRHGLHLNTKGKDFTAKVLRSTIKSIFNTNLNTPIPMNWKADPKVPNSGNSDMSQTPPVLCLGMSTSIMVNPPSDGAVLNEPVIEVSEDVNAKKANSNELEGSSDSGGAVVNPKLPDKQPPPPLIEDNTPEIITGKRNRKKPVLRTNDFLWGI